MPRTSAPAKILIIEDEPAIRVLYTQVLAQAGYEAYTAADPREAVDVMTNQAIDLVLTDLRMPGIGGRTFIKRLRTVPSLEKLPIIVISGTMDSSDILQLKRYGVVGCLSKPVDLEVLQQVVDQALAGSAHMRD